MLIVKSGNRETTIRESFALALCHFSKRKSIGSVEITTALLCSLRDKIFFCRIIIPGKIAS